MKESNILANIAAMKQRYRDILKHIKRQFTKKSNTLAKFAVIKQLRRALLLNIKSQYMKESNTLVNTTSHITSYRS